MIELLAHQNRKVADRILAVSRLAYQQEASLLGVCDFPPLRETVDAIASSQDFFFGCHVRGQLAGVLALDEEQGSATIHRLVVEPAHHRQGIGSALLVTAIKRYDRLRVQTARENQPAVQLYKKFDFVLESERYDRATGLWLSRFRRCVEPVSNP